MYYKFDWAEEWENSIKESSKQIDKLQLVKMWDEKAISYNNCMSQHLERAKRYITKMDIKPNYTILDVGAGTGAFAIPLAKIVKHVTVVEPSIGMINCLKENAIKEGLYNITYINKAFEDVDLEMDLERYDVVFASYSLMMLDIKKTLFKMNEAAKKRIFIFTFAYGNEREDVLYERLESKKYIPGPDYIHLVNILYQMGIDANVNIKKNRYLHEISNIDESVDSYMLRYQVSSDESKEIIKKYLLENMEESEGKTYLLGHSGAATISWKKN